VDGLALGENRQALRAGHGRLRGLAAVLSQGVGRRHPQFPVTGVPRAAFAPDPSRSGRDRSGSRREVIPCALPRPSSWFRPSPLGACALLAPLGAPGRAERRLLAQGQALAATRCLACMARAAEKSRGRRPCPRSPVVGGQRLDWKLETITAVGHDRMRPTPLSSSDDQGLAAYAQSLDPPLSSRP